MREIISIPPERLRPDPTAVLEKADKVNGTFARVSGAASGYQVNTSGAPEGYYRLKK